MNSKEINSLKAKNKNSMEQIKANYRNRKAKKLWDVYRFQEYIKILNIIIQKIYFFNSYGHESIIEKLH